MRCLAFVPKRRGATCLACDLLGVRPGRVRQAWRDLTDGLAQIMTDATVTGRLRSAAVKRLPMPLCEVTGEALDRGPHDLIAAMGAAGVDWEEAARRIVEGKA